MKAVVLCAGFGTRLGRLTAECPKPMLPVAGRPLLAYTLAHLADQGFTEVAINVHYLPTVIPGYFGDGEAWGLRLTYVEESTLRGTAGTVSDLRGWLGNEPFLVQYGDVLTDQDYQPLWQRHAEREAVATVLVHQRAKAMSILDVATDGRVKRFVERPAQTEPVPNVTAQSGVPWVFSGVAVCSPAILDLIPSGMADLPREVFVPLAPRGGLYALPLSGERWAIDSPERLEQANEGVRTGRFQVSPRIENVSPRIESSELSEELDS